MNASKWAVAGVSLLALASLHCSSSQEAPEGESEDAVSVKTPIYDNSPYFWALTDYATFQQVSMPAPFRVGPPLTETDPVTVRLQTWVDRIHEAVAKDVRRKTGKDLVAPKPIVKVLPSKEANAWVSGIPACFTAEADLSALGTPLRPARATNLAFVGFDGVTEATSLFGAPPPKCAAPTNWRSVDDALSFIKASGSKCKLERVGDRVKVSGPGCAIQGDDAPTTAKQLTYYAASPFIQITTAMLALAKDENQVVGVLAHELGHYYRAHIVSDLVMGKYNFWYDQKNPRGLTPPSPSPDAVTLEERFHRVSPYARPKIEGQKLSYRLTSLLVDNLGSLLSAANAANGAKFACADAVGKLAEPWSSDFRGFGASFVRKPTKDGYLAYESALLACAARVPVTSGGGGGTLKLLDVREAVRTRGTEVALPEVVAGTLADVLTTLQDRASVIDRDEEGLMSLIEARPLGRWTAEQEADNFSLSYYVRLGLAPSTRIDTEFEMVKAHNAIDPDHFVDRNGGLDLATCEAMYRADWMTTSSSGLKELAFVTLGDLHDEHHGDCYRLFNLTQELRAHDYRKSGTAPTFAASWEETRSAAAHLTDSFKAGGNGGDLQAPQPTQVLPPGGTIVD
jgi:hypothetical protein